jgi:hypothetical protein
MDKNKFDTLSEAIDSLTSEGFTENFKALEDGILALYSKKVFQPDELRIVMVYRFDSMTNPGDDTAVFAIVATDGLKGTLVMSYGASHSHNVELIRQIREL